jgi:hypothetical protein
MKCIVKGLKWGEGGENAELLCLLLLASRHTMVTSGWGVADVPQFLGTMSKIRTLSPGTEKETQRVKR